MTIIILAGAPWPAQMWADAPERQTNGQTTDWRHLNSMFYASHPNLGVFVDNLLQVQANTYLRKRSLEEKKNAEKTVSIQSWKEYNGFFQHSLVLW